MTRDEVVEECAAVAERHQDVLDDANYIAASIRALKSKPPEKSPEVGDPRVMDMLAAGGEMEAEIHRLRAERDALKAQLGEANHWRVHWFDAYGRLLTQRDANTIRRWQVKEDRYQEQIRTLEAEVARLKWEANGSPMPGETPRSE